MNQKTLNELVNKGKKIKWKTNYKGETEYWISDFKIGISQVIKLKEKIPMKTMTEGNIWQGTMIKRKETEE